MLMRMRPLSISFFSSSERTLRDGSNSATLGSFFSGAFCAPPGPRIIVLPLPMSLTVPPHRICSTGFSFCPSSAFFTDSELSFCRPSLGLHRFGLGFGRSGIFRRGGRLLCRSGRSEGFQLHADQFGG